MSKFVTKMYICLTEPRKIGFFMGVRIVGTGSFIPEKVLKTRWKKCKTPVFRQGKVNLRC